MIFLTAGGCGRNPPIPVPLFGGAPRLPRSWPRLGSPPMWPATSSESYAASGAGINAVLPTAGDQPALVRSPDSKRRGHRKPGSSEDFRERPRAWNSWSFAFWILPHHMTASSPGRSQVASGVRRSFFWAAANRDSALDYSTIGVALGLAIRRTRRHQCVYRGRGGTQHGDGNEIPAASHAGGTGHSVRGLERVLARLPTLRRRGQRWDIHQASRTALRGSPSR